MTTRRRSHAIKHHLPHRTRIKLPDGHRNAATLKLVEDSVKNLPGVKSVDVNHRTGSLLIHHDERSDILPAVNTAVEEVAGEIFEALLEMEGVAIPGLPILAHLLGKGLGSINTSFSDVTRNLVDLKVVLPAGFLAAALYRARQSPGWWMEVPAWALFYYAYDSYLKFHPMLPAAVSEAAAERTEVTTEGESSEAIGLAEVATDVVAESTARRKTKASNAKGGHE